jgi:thymidine kinase
MHHVPEGTGWIEVICGSMFSGKTEELIRRLRRATYARQRVQVFKPRTDDRFDAEAVVSHSEQRMEGIAVDDARDILRLVAEETTVVGIDEAQFFDEELVAVANDLADQGRRVIIAGLDQDYRGRPFEPMPQLLAVAEFVTKTLAICMVCGNPANRSQRLTASESRVVIGAAEAYEARCRRCHTEHPVSAPTQPPLPMGVGPKVARPPVPEQAVLPLAPGKDP